MKTKALIILFVITSAGILTGCVERRVVVHDRGPGVVTESEVIVTEAPPPPQVEVEVRRPSPEYVWIGGYWAWEGRRWDWRPGHWERPPHRHSVWVQSHYEHRGPNHIWIRGHWRN